MDVAPAAMSVEEQLRALTRQIDGLIQQQAIILRRQGALDARIREASEMADGLDVRQDELQTAADRLSLRVDGLAARLDRHDAAAARMSLRVEELSVRLALSTLRDTATAPSSARPLRSPYRSAAAAGHHEATDLFAEMPSRKVCPDVINLSTIVNSCEKGSQWEHAPSLFAELPSQNVCPDMIS